MKTTKMTRKNPTIIVVEASSIYTEQYHLRGTAKPLIGNLIQVSVVTCIGTMLSRHITEQRAVTILISNVATSK